MKTLIAGILLTLSAWIWFLVSSSWGESPMHYVPSRPWYDAGANLNGVLYNLLSPIAHAVLGAGIALTAIRYNRQGSHNNPVQQTGQRTLSAPGAAPRRALRQR